MILCPLCGDSPLRTVPDQYLTDHCGCDCGLVLLREFSPPPSSEIHYSMALRLVPSSSRFFAYGASSVLGNLHLSAFRDGRVDVDDGMSLENLPDPGFFLDQYVKILLCHLVLAS